MNSKLKEWAKDNEVELEYTIPYFHQSNGRVERANRTIRNALRKTPGSTKKKLSKVIYNYNNTFHRGIGMSPMKALDEKNREKVYDWQKNYELDYLKYKKMQEKFGLGDKVLIKNENRKSKMDDLFNNKGVVVENLKHDFYLIKKDEGGIVKRHSSQFKGLGRGMLDIKYPGVIS
jgi:hypothetical protein